MKVTIKDIAREAGVSVSMVSYVLNKTGRPTLDSHKRILEIARRQHYVPDANARGLVTGVTNNIGLVVPQQSEAIFAQPFMVKCLSEFGKCLSECSGWLSLCLGTDLSAATLRKYLANAKLDGIIFMYAEEAEEIADFLTSRRTPFIFFDRFGGGGNASSVACDDQAGIGMAFEHLKGLGHDRMLFLSGREAPPQDGRPDRRLEAYFQKAAQYGMADAVLYGGYTKQGGYDALAAHLQRGGGLPGAILAANDRMAWGVIKLLRERDVRVPEDVSVVGYDDADEEYNEDVGLTTARQPIADLARFCVQYIYDAVESGEMKPVEVRMMPELIVRRTTAKPG